MTPSVTKEDELTKKHIVKTLGTSNHTFEKFHSLLEKSGADVIVDVRASPFSRHRHFCQAEFKAKLNHAGFSYLHVPSLGGLGVEDHRRFAEAVMHPAAQAGLELIAHIATRGVPILVCSEWDCTTCHRFLMISPQLVEIGLQVSHVQPDGRIETHAETEARLVRKLRLREQELWEPWEKIVARAFEIQERKIRRLK